MKHTFTRSANSVAPSFGRKKAFLEITVETTRGYFSVTGHLYSPGHKPHPFACGCLHDEIAKISPNLKPLIALHLSDVETGEPSYAEENGWYWITGIVPDFNHRFSPHQTPEECRATLQAHLRATDEEMVQIMVCCLLGGDPTLARKWFASHLANHFAPRWKAEADAGRELIGQMILRKAEADAQLEAAV